MSYRLFLDDLRDPPSSDWVVARSYLEAVDIVRQNGCPVEISFDHDLGLEGSVEMNGYDFAKWLINADLDDQITFPPDFKFTVHSANPVGKANIEGLFRCYSKATMFKSRKRSPK